MILRAYSIQGIDTVSAGYMFLAQMRRAVCFSSLAAEDI